MKSPRVIALLVVLAAVRAPAVAEQASNRSDALTIGVTVDPICTVAITAGEFDPDDSIDVNCRNLRRSQPRPIVSVPADGLSSAAADAGTVVIHF